MKPFRKRRRARVTATFEPAEAQLLGTLVAQVIELLRDRSGVAESDVDPLAAELGLGGGPAVAPEDPALLRLLPDAYVNDEVDAAEYRRLTERSLASAKVANAEVVLAALAAGGHEPSETSDASGSEVEVELDADQVVAWLRTLNDVRLALAVRLDIETDEDATLIAHSADPAKVAMGEVYDWLGFVQESLVVTQD